MIINPSALLHYLPSFYAEDTVLRFYQTPELYGKELFLHLLPCNIDERSQNQRQGNLATNFEEVLSRTLMLTVNGLIITGDNKAVFHRKNGGYLPGSLHTFGGYVGASDFQENCSSVPLERAVIRELEEETGVEKENLKVSSWFGPEPYGLSPLWDYGTCALTALVKTPYQAKDLLEKIKIAKSHQETLNNEVIMIQKEHLSLLEKETLHPQLRAALSGIDLAHYL